MIKQAYTIPGFTGLTTLPESEGVDYDRELSAMTMKGLASKGLHTKPEYLDRLTYELGIIRKKGVAVYFIILEDIIRFCFKNDIPWGFGRGSAAGSLIAYALDIVSVDPLEYNLIFERFMDIDREDMPDIDLDVSDSRREEVIIYLRNKYGEDHVAGISNFLFFADKAAFTAACKVFCLPFAQTKEISKNIETLEDLARIDAGEFVRQNKRLVRLALALRGRFTGYGRHAAGQVITSMPIHDIAPVESRSVGDTRKPVVALDKNQAEELGLVKIDLLGLKTLSVVDDAIKMIKENHQKIIDFKTIPDDDANVYEMLARGETVGVFQLESGASTDLAKKMKLASFTDLYISNALVRSGAWNAFGEDYLETRAGKRKPYYSTEDIKPYLEDTLGYSIFQESSMKICEIVAGLSVIESNKIRKLTAKKKSKEELAPYKEKFINGCIKNDVSKTEAEKLWANIETTAEYQFNKCLSYDTEVMIRHLEDGKRVMQTVNLEYLNEAFDRLVDLEVLGPEKIKGPNVSGQAWCRVKAIHNNGEQPCFRIHIDKDRFIDSTWNHQHRLSKRWKQAYRIHQNDPIWTIDGKHDVAWRRYCGIKQTYDLELYDEPHAFYANGFLTHNSHSVAYSKLSIVTAWLKYHYPAEFMTALLNHSDGNDNMLPEYLNEIKRLGIPLRRPDVNKSGVNYVTRDGVIYMGLRNIKNISEKSAERFILNRPYKSYEDLKEKVTTKGSGLTTRMLASLEAVGAADFDDHKTPEETVRDNLYEYLGIVSFDSRAITPGMRSKMFDLDAYDDNSVGIVDAMVQGIVQKNGWTRIDFMASTGKVSFFVDENHGMQKGGQYLLLFNGRKLVMHFDLSDKSENTLTRYLTGEMKQGLYLVGAKAFKTKTGKMMANAVLSKDEQLFGAVIFSDDLHKARSVPLGSKIKIQAERKRDGTIIIKEMAKVE